MSKVRVSACMNSLVQEERLFLAQWKTVLVSRRQQWLRERINLALLSGSVIISSRTDGMTENSIEQKKAVFRVQIDLDDRDEIDSRIISHYQKKSKTRRGEWLRDALVLGGSLSRSTPTIIIHSDNKLIGQTDNQTSSEDRKNKLDIKKQIKLEAPKKIKRNIKTKKDDVSVPEENIVINNVIMNEEIEPSAEKFQHASALRGLFG